MKYKFAGISGLFLDKSGKFLVGNGQSNDLTYFTLTLNKKSHVVIKQYIKESGAQNIWTFTKIDDEILSDHKNPESETIPNVMFYASDPFYQTFSSEFGRIENMILYQGKGISPSSPALNRQTIR